MKINKMILSHQTIGKEYQIPELVELNNINETLAACSPGSGDTNCASGTGGGA
jgi:hypothetical protein